MGFFLSGTGYFNVDLPGFTGFQFHRREWHVEKVDLVAIQELAVDHYLAELHIDESAEVIAQSDEILPYLNHSGHDRSTNDFLLTTVYSPVAGDKLATIQW